MPDSIGLPKRVLIANRGEIALRVARTVRRLGLTALGIYTAPDAGLPHLRLCQEALELPGEPRRAYLDIQAVIAAAKQLKADAIHPGYGFLSENADFSEAVEKAGIQFIGPRPAEMRRLGDKLAGRKEAKAAGLPTVPGSDGPMEIETPEKLQAAQKLADSIGYPVLVKASAGGGGRGMREVESTAQLKEALTRANSEALAAFGDGRVFIEKFFPRVRHVEIQVLGDGAGKAVSLGERDCSVQRRHQKLIEESPAPELTRETAAKMGALAAKMAGEVNYRGAGTFEFLVPFGTQEFYFIEVNARLQVEHPVTEIRWGLDLVEEQLRISAGLGFSFPTREVDGYGGRSLIPAWEPHGAAIEARVIAEDPHQGFRPSLGKLEFVQWPSGPGVRSDAWAESGLEVSPFYDSLLGKVIGWGRTRDEARTRLIQALHETLLIGADALGNPLNNTASFIAQVIGEPEFASGKFDTGLLGRRKPAVSDTILPAEALLTMAAELKKNSAVNAPEFSYHGRNLSDWQRAEGGA
jgi:acetyl/propionyl-CoA carboxylase alpha subunit